MIAVDQAVRDRAVHELDLSMALSAGAGSGKTTVLTDRVLALLESGIEPARIAAITFTEKAAGELQVRVRDGLERRLGEAPSPALEQALQRLPELVISTIHSFCQHILVAEALEAGWAPDTEILPRIVSSEAVARAFDRWEADLRAREPLAAHLVRRCVNPKTLREAAVRLLGFRDLDPVVDPERFDVARAHAGLLEVIERIEEAAEGCRKPETDKLLAGNAPLLQLLRDARAGEPAGVVARVLGSDLGPKRAGGRRQDWADGAKEGFIDALGAFEEWRARSLSALHGLVVRDLREHFLPAVEAAKRAAAVADFDDLLFRAAALLGDPVVRARIASRFDAVLVDEVQDTDPIQAEVAALVARDVGAEGPWNAHPPHPGRLFAVGDPRQSIYRFRRADIETWAELQALIRRNGETLSLVQNFRSVPGIVEWVNATFADLPGYVPQQAARRAGALPPVVRLVTEPDPEEELEAVVRHLLEQRSVGEVVDRETGALRPLRWSDVMILLPAWARSEAVHAALGRAGIPSLVEGGGVFFERDEVRLAVAALKCLDEPADERSTVLVLRGLFGLDWDTLARHRAAGGAWRHTIPDPPAGPVAEAFALLRELHRQRGRVSWVVLLDELLERTRAAAVWATLRDGQARLANLDKLRALVRRVEAATRSPTQALEELAALDREEELSRVDYDSDAVRITSYFKAKGLEAPVIVLCCAHRNADPVQVVVDRRTRRVALKVGDLVPREWEALREREKAAMNAERRRWMYVAATRARDQLVFVDHEKSSFVREHFVNGLPLASDVEPGPLPDRWLHDETFPGCDAQVDAWLAEPPPPEPDPTEAWVTSTRDAVRDARAASTRWRSVQQIAARERVSRATSPVGVLGGTVVHDVMQALDLTAPLEDQLALVEERVRGSAAVHGASGDLAERCSEIVRGLLRHPVLDRARRAPERWVEVPFAIRDGGRMVSGRIDLAFPTDPTRRQWVVVDWKSDVPAKDTPAWRNYQRQLALYAKALLRTVSPCEEVETVLVGPHPELGSAVEDLGLDVMPELVPGLEGLVARGAPRPRVGADAGDPIVAQAELAWDEQRVALCVGRPASEAEALRAQGWTVTEADPTGLAWADEAVAALAASLGLA